MQLSGEEIRFWVQFSSKPNQTINVSTFLLLVWIAYDNSASKDSIQLIHFIQ